MAATNKSYSRRMEIYNKKPHENATNLIINDHYLIKSSRVLTLDKLTSTEINSILISKVKKK